MTRAFVPAEILDLAHARAVARAAREWAAADDLRARIEAAGWKVVDSGTHFRLEPLPPPVLLDERGERYGRSEAIPSRFGEPASAPATVVLVAGGPDAEAALRTAEAVTAHAAAETHVVLVVEDDAPATETAALEVVRLVRGLGSGAAWNAGLRRARGELVVFLDPGLVVTGDIVRPLAEAFEDPTAAVVGRWGLRSADLRRFEAVEAGPAVAVDGRLLAFRRADGIARGPLDEGFRTPAYLDAWWSLVLRDAPDVDDPEPNDPGVAAREATAEGAASGGIRSALVLPGLPVSAVESDAEGLGPSRVPNRGDRATRRNFYRLLDAFGGRTDLLADAP